MAEYKGKLFDAPPKVAESVPPPVTESVQNPVAESVSAPVSETVATPVLAAPSGVTAMNKTFAEGAQQLQTDYRKKVDETTTSNVNVGGNQFNLPSFFTSPAGYVAGLGGAALLGGAAVKYVPPLITKAKDMANRWLSSPAGAQQAAQMVDLAEPPMTSSTAAPMQDVADYEPPMSRTAAPSQNLTIEEAKARMAGVTPAAPVTPSVVPAAAPVVPEAAAPAIVEAPKPVAPSAAPNSPVTQAVSETVKDLIQAETPKVAPARPVTPTPAAALPVAPTVEPVNPSAYNQRVQTAIAGVPPTVQAQFAKEGKVALKGYGAGDINLTNTYGMPAYQKIIDYFNNGQPIGSYDNYLEVQKKINKGIPSSLASEFAPKLPGSEAESGNFGKAFGETGAYTAEGKIVKSPNAMKNAVKGGGAIFLATAIPNLANAAEAAMKGDYAKAGGQAAGVAYGAMGPLGQLLTGTGSAGLSAEEEARQLRMRDYALQAGRGVAQGYDPRRLIGVASPTR